MLSATTRSGVKSKHLPPQRHLSHRAGRIAAGNLPERRSYRVFHGHLCRGMNRVQLNSDEFRSNVGYMSKSPQKPQNAACAAFCRDQGEGAT